MGVLDETTRFQVHKRLYVHAKISSVVKGITVEACTFDMHRSISLLRVRLDTIENIVVK